MQLLLIILGYINGKMGVKCVKCLRLKNGKCLGRTMTSLEQEKPRICGLWKKRYVWVKRHTSTKEDNFRLKNDFIAR